MAFYGGATLGDLTWRLLMYLFGCPCDLNSTLRVQTSFATRSGTLLAPIDVVAKDPSDCCLHLHDGARPTLAPDIAKRRSKLLSRLLSALARSLLSHSARVERSRQRVIQRRFDFLQKSI